ncbi:MAG: hypothetical protein JWO38_751 [Gemmataceae bacterium]|nr:hypothetical protein [Gemmataceae bacterium]
MLTASAGAPVGGGAIRESPAGGQAEGGRELIRLGQGKLGGSVLVRCRPVLDTLALVGEHFLQLGRRASRHGQLGAQGMG